MEPVFLQQTRLHFDLIFPSHFPVTCQHFVIGARRRMHSGVMPHASASSRFHFLFFVFVSPSFVSPLWLYIASLIHYLNLLTPFILPLLGHFLLSISDHAPRFIIYIYLHLHSLSISTSPDIYFIRYIWLILLLYIFRISTSSSIFSYLCLYYPSLLTSCFIIWLFVCYQPIMKVNFTVFWPLILSTSCNLFLLSLLLQPTLFILCSSHMSQNISCYCPSLSFSSQTSPHINFLTMLPYSRLINVHNPLPYNRFPPSLFHFTLPLSPSDRKSVV